MNLKFCRITAYCIIATMLFTTSFAFAENVPDTSNEGQKQQTTSDELLPERSSGAAETGDDPESLPEESGPKPGAPEPDPEDPVPEPSVVVPIPEGLMAANTAAGIKLTWAKTTDAEGYYILRKEAANAEWIKLAEATSTVTTYEDRTAANGKTYYYTIQAYIGETVSEYATEQMLPRVAAVPIKSWKRLSTTAMRLIWNRVSASGYEIQYAADKNFKAPALITISNPTIVSKDISKLQANTKYYVRMRAYILSSTGEKHYSVWTQYSGKRSTINFSPVVLKKGKKTFELRTQTKQKLYQYDVLQGSCTDGTYGYYILYHKKKEKCKIAKVRLSNMKVVKVSKVLGLSHGNDMAYNSTTKKLVVVHTTQKPWRLTVVNPKTLKIERNVNVKMPSTLKGATAKQLKAAKAFSGIAYNKMRRQYILYFKGSHDFVTLNESFKPVSFIKASVKNNTTYQGLDASDDYIFVAQSPKSGTKQTYNIISVYDWDGEYLFQINVKKGYEIESVYHIGNTYYAGFYRAYYKKLYKYKKKKVKTKVKWKKVNGKWKYKYKYKKKKVKVAYKKQYRSNYIYRIGTIS